MMIKRLAAKRRKKKQRKLSTHKKAAWDAMSLAIRYAASDEAGYAQCSSCSKMLPWREMDAGHYQPKARGNALYFFHANVNTQCKRCNLQGGNPAGYTVFMLREHGAGMIERIKELSGTTVKYTRADYDAIRDHYRAEYNRIVDARAQGKKHRLVGYR